MKIEPDQYWIFEANVDTDVRQQVNHEYYKSSFMGHYNLSKWLISKY